MENPFESGHIKNYVLLYVSIVVIMVLFFIASTLFNDVKSVEKKVFNTVVEVANLQEKKPAEEEKENKFRLLDKSY